MKDLLGHTLFGSRLDRLLLRKTAVVVTFHRVQESVEPDDGLTVSARLFERYCRFFSSHFRVVPLREIVERLECGRPLNHELAITFDDGYRDNFEVAAPILASLSLTATFFVVTRWIATDIVPWWDAARGARHPWMSWNQVRVLRERGFDIGAHTRTHVDLGSVSGSLAQDEIGGARIDLERETGAPAELFAYPYGLASHITPANRSLIEAAGFRCCCSGFGGVNTAGTSPFHVYRVPISVWNRSPHEFGVEVALGRSAVTA